MSFRIGLWMCIFAVGAGLGAGGVAFAMKDGDAKPQPATRSSADGEGQTVGIVPAEYEFLGAATCTKGSSAGFARAFAISAHPLGGGVWTFTIQSASLVGLPSTERPLADVVVPGSHPCGDVPLATYELASVPWDPTRPASCVTGAHRLCFDDAMPAALGMVDVTFEADGMSFAGRLAAIHVPASNA